MYAHSVATEMAKEAIKSAIKNNFKIATAESCTAGLICATLTEVPGSSAAVDRGFVTYSNEAKNEMLGVDAELIESKGAVSEEVARAMADGALKNSNADLAIAVTGIAGPDGGTADKPVGLVHFALSSNGREKRHDRKIFSAMDRESVRAATVEHALVMVIETVTRRGFVSIE